MGYFRCLSKPIKRFLFYYADKVANEWALIVVENILINLLKNVLN